MTKKQETIPGLERAQVEELNTAAEHYVEQRDKRMATTKEEKAAKVALIAAMRKHKCEVYRDDDASPPLVVTLIPGEDQVKVTEAQEQPGEEEEAA